MTRNTDVRGRLAECSRVPQEDTVGMKWSKESKYSIQPGQFHVGKKNTKNFRTAQEPDTIQDTH